EAESGSNLAQLYFYGIIFGLLLVILLQKKFQLNLCIMLNLSFALLALGFVIRLIILHYPILIYISTLCFGLAYGIGMVNIYYLAGFMAKKFQNITFYRVGILLSAIFYFSGFGLAYLFRDAYLLLSILSVCIVIAFFALSPMFLRLLYQGEWIDDTYRQDVTFDSRLQSRLKELKLSPQEIQVCTLLLCGYTLRQTASTLALAYPTVNTYCTAIYRKLSINSRAELLLMFKDYKEDTETPPH
ncbi:MAG: LuxR C-terminal-related transcriptional regulator, partial [Anaerovoracaceae bacterium]